MNQRLGPNKKFLNSPLRFKKEGLIAILSQSPSSPSQYPQLSPRLEFFSYSSSQVNRRKHPALSLKMNLLFLLFINGEISLQNTNRRPWNDLSTFRRNHMFSSYVQYAHASVMTRARIARIKTRTISVFLICKSQLPLLEKKWQMAGYW